MASDEWWKDLVTLDRLILDCIDAIKRQGAHARVVFRIPGKWGEEEKTELFKGGPIGTIASSTNDGKKLLVMCRADKTLTELEAIKNGIITSLN